MINRNMTLMLFASLFLWSCRTISENSSEPKIFNGTVANRNSEVAKHTVALVYKRKPSSPVCTGILISDRYVLTAQHCTFTLDWKTPEKISVAFGLGLVPSDRVKVVQAEEEIYTDDSVIKDGHDETPQINNFRISDIAILKLPKGTVIPDFMTPVKIAEAAEFPVGTEVILAGYGALGTTPDGSVSGELIKNSPALLYETTTRITKISAEEQNLITYSSDNKLNSACTGDSGGPMFIQDPVSKKLKVVGVTKARIPFDADSGKCIGKGLYTNAAFFKNWIEKKIGTP